MKRLNNCKSTETDINRICNQDFVQLKSQYIFLLRKNGYVISISIPRYRIDYNIKQIKLEKKIVTQAIPILTSSLTSHL